MARTIIVEPEKLESAATQIDTDASEYKKVFEQLFTEVNAMGAAWQGADNIAYTTQIEGFRDDFEAMYTLMTQYSQFLKEAAKTYKATQSDIITASKKLVN